MDEHDPDGPRQPELSGFSLEPDAPPDRPVDQQPAIDINEEPAISSLDECAVTDKLTASPATEDAPVDAPEQHAVEPVDHDSLTDSARLDQLSVPYLGRWQQLVSTSNWEKGRIILEWREALISDGAPVSEYADDAWATRVETVSGQHVGRLRRVYHRFGTRQDNFAGLFWSHFQAALDWDDAEMWLEGAVLNSWSVSGMRHQRWEALGARPTDKPLDEEIVVAELDEDRSPEGIEREISASYDEAHAGPLHEGSDFGEESIPAVLPFPAAAAHQDDSHAEATVALVSPFRDVEILAGDLGQAVESIKLAILYHKAAGWVDVDAQTVLDNLEALKQLLLAPADD